MYYITDSRTFTKFIGDKGGIKFKQRQSDNYKGWVFQTFMEPDNRRLTIPQVQTQTKSLNRIVSLLPAARQQTTDIIRTLSADKGKVI